MSGPAWSPPRVPDASDALITPFAGDFNWMWVAQGLQVFGFTPAQASNMSSSTRAAVVLTLPNVGPSDGQSRSILGLAVAPNGDMWLGFGANSANGQYLAKLSASKLLSTGSLTPDWSFPMVAPAVSTIGARPWLITNAGDLWVTTVASSSDPKQAGMLMYTAASIASAGSPSPAVILAQSVGLNSITDFQMDPAGNIWFSNPLNATPTVNRFSAAQLLVTDTSIVPDIALTIGTRSRIGLDTFGNLWASLLVGGSASQIGLFIASDIAISGSPSAVRNVQIPASDFGRVRFDHSGNFWVSAAGGPLGFSPVDFATGGSPPARVAVTNAGAFSAAASPVFT